MLQGIVSVLLAIVSVGLLAVIVSPRAKTSQVITAGGAAFSNAITAAQAPVLDGLRMRPSTGYGVN